MDELQMIREAYGEPAPPTLREMTEARARVIRESPRRRVRFGPRLGAGLGVVAAGAAVAVGLTTVGSGSPAPPSRVDLGKQAVLAAADKAAVQPIGKYWFSDQVVGQSYIIRAESGAYAITGAHVEFFRWAGARTGMGEAFYGRDLPSRPLTPQDRVRWEKAGSPSKFRVWSNDHYYTYDLSKTPWDADDPDPAGGGKWLGTMTVEQLRDLPTDPDELAAQFFSREGMLAYMDPRKRELVRKRMPKGPLSASEKLSRVEDLVRETPVPPAVRAGLMRALAAQPGVTAIGAVTDPLGRKGVALAVDLGTSRVTGEFGAPAAERGEFGSRDELVFDRRTGELLASQRVLTRPGGAYRDRAPGFVINYWLVRDSGWTDTRPNPPAKLPF